MINLNEMEVGKSYILTLRDGEEKEMVCCNKYNDYVNFGYFNWNFYFNGKYKNQNLPSMDIISYCNAPLTEVEKLRQQLQAKEEEIEKLKNFLNYCFDLSLIACSDSEKYKGIYERADEILKGYGNELIKRLEKLENALKFYEMRNHLIFEEPNEPEKYFNYFDEDNDCDVWVEGGEVAKLALRKEIEV